jgi:hypothetical protein
MPRPPRPPRAVGVATSLNPTVLGARALCAPCPAGTFVLTGGTQCSACDASRVCPLGSWTNGGWQPTIPLLRAATTTVPIVTGVFTPPGKLAYFDTQYAIIGGGLIVLAFIVFSGTADRMARGQSFSTSRQIIAHV